MIILRRRENKQRDEKMAYLRKIQGSSILQFEGNETLNQNQSIRSILVQDEDLSHDSPKSKAPSESIPVAMRRIK